MNSQDVLSVLVIIVFILSAMAILFYYIRLKHHERIELIKKGNTVFETNYLENMKYSILNKSILLVSFSIGFGIGYLITKNTVNKNTVIIYLISLTGCAGLGLLLFYFLIRKKTN